LLFLLLGGEGQDEGGRQNKHEKLAWSANTDLLHRYVFYGTALGDWIRWATFCKTGNVPAKNPLLGGEDTGEGERQNILSIPDAFFRFACSFARFVTFCGHELIAPRFRVFGVFRG
jgi:hypothetical protein